jgi:DNA invertase Pin-like site-specific DNA recombinase
MSEQADLRNDAMYIRVSTDGQDPQRQKDAIVRESGRDDLHIYADVESGKNDTRDDFIRLQDDIEAGKIGTVFVEEASRISRRLQTIEMFVSKCVENDVTFRVTGGGFPDIKGGDAMSRAIVRILGTIIELEVDLTRERVHSEYQSAIDNNEWWGRPPYGFTSENRQLIVEPNKFLKMDAALDMVSAGSSYNNAGKTTGIAPRTVQRVWEDEEKRSLYFDTESSDARKQAALDEKMDELNHADNDESVKAQLNGLVARVNEIESRLAEVERGDSGGQE